MTASPHAPFFRTQAAHRAYLNVTAIVVGSFGPVFFFGTMLDTAGPARWTLDLLSWPLDGNIPYVGQDVRFLSALTGGFLLGWGVTIWQLGRRVYPAAPEAVRRVVLSGILAWFVLDTLGSIASGNASNAAFNVLVLVFAVGPLWWPAQEVA